MLWLVDVVAYPRRPPRPLSPVACVECRWTLTRGQDVQVTWSGIPTQSLLGLFRIFSLEALFLSLCNRAACSRCPGAATGRRGRSAGGHTARPGAAASGRDRYSPWRALNVGLGAARSRPIAELASATGIEHADWPRLQNAMPCCPPAFALAQ